MNLIVLAMAPAIIVILYIYFRDKFEKEPILFLFKTFLLGATASVIVTFILSIIGNIIFPITNELSIVQQFFKAFILVGLVEEFSKYIIVRYYNQPNTEFNEPYDGIVYAVMVSMGFATLENILYTFQYGVGTGIVRAFTAIPAHATFGILMGFYMGKAKFLENKTKFNLIGLFVATLFHGTYDFFLFINFVPGIYLGAFVSLIVGIKLSLKAIKTHQENSNFRV